MKTIERVFTLAAVGALGFVVYKLVGKFEDFKDDPFGMIDDAVNDLADKVIGQPTQDDIDKGVSGVLKTGLGAATSGLYGPRREIPVSGSTYISPFLTGLK